ncbi:MAG: hypothetical protein U1F57_03380 [bacterium]
MSDRGPVCQIRPTPPVPNPHAEEAPDVPEQMTESGSYIYIETELFRIPNFDLNRMIKEEERRFEEMRREVDRLLRESRQAPLGPCLFCGPARTPPAWSPLRRPSPGQTHQGQSPTPPPAPPTPAPAPSRLPPPPCNTRP